VGGGRGCYIYCQPGSCSTEYLGFQHGAVAIMVTLRRVGCFIGAGVVAAASASSLPRVNSPRSQSATRAVAAMDPRISSFVQSLALPTAQAAFLHGKSWDASTLTSAACAGLKLVLGEAKVDTKPVDFTLVDDNWLVSIVTGPLLPIL
jgi:hypothetical protein